MADHDVWRERQLMLNRIAGLEVELKRLREDRDRLAQFIEDIADQGFQVMRREDGSSFVVTSAQV